MIVNKKLITLLVVAIGLAALVLLFTSNSLGAKTLWAISRGGTWLAPLVFVSALVDSINPCAFSILLLTITFLLSIGRLRKNILTIGAAYILGIYLVYLLIGLGILQTLHLFNTPHFMAKLGASLLILVGIINLAGYYVPSFPVKLKIPSVSHKMLARYMEKASVPAALILGVLVGICEFPCTGGPYLMVLGLLHDRATYFTGFLYLLWYNAIFVLPLAVMLAIASNGAILDSVEAWRKHNAGQMKVAGGIIMILLGLLIFIL